jgi:putative transposase
MARPPRLAGFDYRGLHRYFLTFCTFKRQTFFLDPQTVTQTLLQFRKTSAQEGMAILAYCFMLDHAHMLVEGLYDGADMKRFCRLSKQRSGTIHARSIGGPLWQEGYYDRVLRPDEDILSVARYMLNNPVRAGLVSSPIDYPYLGSDRWSIEELLDAQLSL